MYAVITVHSYLSNTHKKEKAHRSELFGGLSFTPNLLVLFKCQLSSKKQSKFYMIREVVVKINNAIFDQFGTAVTNIDVNVICKVLAAAIKITS
jgi:hypothetical protein